MSICETKSVGTLCLKHEELHLLKTNLMLKLKNVKETKNLIHFFMFLFFTKQVDNTISN